MASDCIEIEDRLSATLDYQLTFDYFKCILIVYSVLLLLLTAFTATRSKTHGSWFIRMLVATFYRHASHRDVETLFKIVSTYVYGY